MCNASMGLYMDDDHLEVSLSGCRGILITALPLFPNNQGSKSQNCIVEIQKKPRKVKVLSVAT